jgi:hypothetical protein
MATAETPPESPMTPGAEPLWALALVLGQIAGRVERATQGQTAPDSPALADDGQSGAPGRACPRTEPAGNGEEYAVPYGFNDRQGTQVLAG